ncbi:serine/threonine-protein kinase [Amycolatopsis suaedae]|uniref:non-specific serine/threonine protein kinase n=1 Tax=Amycolatopsis suaedae TaxID=2510978 RepID=A0A4Q7J054_9PSEU|nr:serine/threonine-protein kinase [Amycolatopsis suaedae]RZQ60088.1 serine/threonine protein kinase [Amycolatopsis suaedae]
MQDRVVAGRYRLVEQIGTGGMGVVWRALDQDKNRTVALKQARIADSGSGRRLRREARLAAELSHPNVVSVYESIVDGDELWLVMEYVPARNLAERLEDDGPLPVPDVTRIGTALAGALAAVHDRGIVHRDVKPSNVLLPDDGVKLTDFGISRSVATDETLTDAAVVGGTPGYLAPEVAEGREPTPASDVFSLGATLFAAVEGVPPVSGANPYAVLRRTAAGELTAPRRAGALAPLLAELLRVDPAERPSATAAARRLAELDGSVPPVRPRRRRSRRLAAIAAVVLAVVVTATVVTIVVGSGRGTGQLTSPPVAQVSHDLHAADPCALVDPKPLAHIGAPTVDPAYGGFNRCDVLLDLPGDHEVDIRVELEEPPGPGGKPEGEVVRVGAVDVHKGLIMDGRCLRTIPLPDGYRVVVTAVDYKDPAVVDLCAVADIATATAAAVIERSGVPRRAVALPRESLAWLNACSLLDNATIGRLTPLGAAKPEPFYGNWVCDYELPTTEDELMVRFDRNEPLKVENGRFVRMSDRDVRLIEGDYGPDTCEADIVYRTYTNANGEDTIEMVQIVLSGPPPTARLCEPVAELARVVAARLPRP